MTAGRRAGACPRVAVMRTCVVLQSRLTSSRLPGKALLVLGGRPVVVLAAQRAARTGLDVRVATSVDPADDAVAAEVQAAGISCFRGSLEDPLARFVAATADLDDHDVVVRLTADNVVPDGELVQELVAAIPDDGYVRTSATLPYGLSAEAFRVGLLRAAGRRASTTSDREHVTPAIRRMTADTEFVPVAGPGPSPDDVSSRLRCTIDTLDDFVVAHRALAAEADPVAVPWHRLLARWAEAGGITAPVLPGVVRNPLGQGPWVLGTVQLGLDYGTANTSGRPSESAARELLSTAAAAGATHADTARAYGKSESRLGRSLALGLSERLGVVTKVAPLPADLADGSAAWAVRLSVEQSLRALGVSTVAALLVHRWADWGRDDGAVADTLDGLRRDGVAVLVGASVTSPDELVSALEDSRVGYVQMPFNLLDRRWLAGEVQEALAARPDVVVTVRSVFLQGLLAAPRSARWPAAGGVAGAALTPLLEAVAADLGRDSTADLALSYVRAHGFVTSVVLGAESVEQVLEHARLMRRPPLTDDEVRVVHQRIGPGSPTLVDPSRWRMEP